MARRTGPSANRAFDRPLDGGWQGGEDDLAALAPDLQDAVAVFLAEVGDVGAARFEDPQAEQPQHGHQGEVVGVRRRAGRAEQGFELQVRQAERG